MTRHLQVIIDAPNGERVCACCGRIVGDAADAAPSGIPASAALAGSHTTGSPHPPYAATTLGSPAPGRVPGVANIIIYGSGRRRVTAARDAAAVDRYCPPSSCPRAIRDDVLDMVRRLRDIRAAAGARLHLNPGAILALRVIAADTRGVAPSYRDLRKMMPKHCKRARHSLNRYVGEFRRDLSAAGAPILPAPPADSVRTRIWQYGSGLPRAALDAACILADGAAVPLAGRRPSVIAAACVYIGLAGGLPAFVAALPGRPSRYRLSVGPIPVTRIAGRYHVSAQPVRDAAYILAGRGPC